MFSCMEDAVQSNNSFPHGGNQALRCTESLLMYKVQRVAFV